MMTPRPVDPELLAILQDLVLHLQDRPGCLDLAWIGQGTVRRLAESLDYRDALQWPLDPGWTSPFSDAG